MTHHYRLTVDIVTENDVDWLWLETEVRDLLTVETDLHSLTTAGEVDISVGDIVKILKEAER